MLGPGIKRQNTYELSSPQFVIQLKNLDLGHNQHSTVTSRGLIPDPDSFK
jgi:hypothetical protein